MDDESKNEISSLYSTTPMPQASSKRRMTEHSRKWSTSGLDLDDSESEARRLEKKGTFTASIDEEANTVSMSKSDFKAVMSKLSSHKKVAKRSQSNFLYLAFGYLAVSVMFIGTIIGLVNWRLEATKETVLHGSILESQNGTVAQIGSVKSYAQLYDLPRFDVTTLSQVNFIGVTLEDDTEYGFRVSEIKKKSGEKKVTFYANNGDSVAIDGNSRASTATISGKLHLVKDTAALPSARRLFASDEHDPRLYENAEFFQLRKDLAERRLSTGSAHLGYAELVMRAADAILDSQRDSDTAAVYDSALIKGRILVREAGTEDTIDFTVHRNKTDDSYQTYFDSRGHEGGSTSWLDTRSYGIASKNGGELHCMPLDATAVTDSSSGALDISTQAIDEGVMISASSGVVESDGIARTTVMIIDSIEFNRQSDIIFPTSEECYAAHKRYRPSQRQQSSSSGSRRSLSVPSIDCEMLELAKAAYSDYGDVGDWTRTASCGGKGTGFLCVGSCENAFASLFTNSAGKKAIAFRGSDDLVDFIKDIAGGTDSSYGVALHRGVVQEFRKLEDCVLAWGRPDYGAAHSLGGALLNVYSRVHAPPRIKVVTFGALATSATGQCNIGTSTSDSMRWANVNDPAVGNLPLFGWNRLGHVNHDLKKATSTTSHARCGSYVHYWGCRGCGWRGCDSCGWIRTGTCKPWSWSLAFGGHGGYGQLGCADKQANMDITGLFGKAWDAHGLFEYGRSMGCY